MARRNRNPPWADLPQELLSAIADFLVSNPMYIFTFRCICHSWRSACPPLSLSNSPLLSPPLPLSISLSPRFYSLDFITKPLVSVTIIYALHRPIQLPQGGFSALLPDAWILFVDEFIPGKLSIRKPFSNISYSTPINFPSNVNLIDSGFRELGRFYNLTHSHDRKKPRFKRNNPCFRNMKLNKVVMFPNLIAAIALREDGTLGMPRLNVGINAGITKCEIKHDGKGFRFDDIIEFKGRVLGIDRRGRVYEINYHSSQMTPFVAPIAGGGGRRKRLVESLGRLYLVVRSYVDPAHNNKLNRLKEDIRKIRFKVYELNEEKKKWIEISSLGDRSFIFDRKFSFSASVHELGTCVKNCILFNSVSFLSYSSNGDDKTGLKNCELDLSVCHLHEPDHFAKIESYPGYSDSLWPPPSWLWSIDRLKRIGIVEAAIDEILGKVPEKYKTDVDVDVDVERADDLNPVVLEFVKVLKLKNTAVRFREEEIELKYKLHEADSLFEQGRTGSHGIDRTTEDRLGLLDNLKTGQTRRDHLLQPTMSMLRRRDASLLYIEEQATEVKLSLEYELEIRATLLQYSPELTTTLVSDTTFSGFT